MLDLSLIVPIVYALIMLAIIVTSLTKASYHLNYLKEILPEEYDGYNSYSSAFSFENYNISVQFLFFPSFYRSPEKENEFSASIAKKVIYFKNLSLFFIGVFILPIIVLILTSF